MEEGNTLIAMDKKDAKKELERIIKEYRLKKYGFWQSLMDRKEQITFDFTNDKGNWYQVEIQAFYDSEQDRTIRVSFSIDDGKLRVFAPMTDDFIINSQNEFVGEKG